MAAASGVGFALVGGATYVTASAIAGTWLTLAALASLPSRRSELVAVVQERDGPASVFEGEIRDLRFVREGGVRSLRIGGAGYSLLVDEPHITDALGLILPHVNRRGGRPAEVARATDAIATAGGPGPYLESFAVDRVSIDNLGPASRLGLEMAAHETVEAAALDGELKVLQRRWQTAEKLAAISDGLFRDREEMLLARLKSDLTPVSRSS